MATQVWNDGTNREVQTKLSNGVITFTHEGKTLMSVDLKGVIRWRSMDVYQYDGFNVTFYRKDMGGGISIEPNIAPSKRRNAPINRYCFTLHGFEAAIIEQQVLTAYAATRK
jgi:hypothetical protein